MAILASMIVGAALVGCGDATGPTSPIAGYALSSVGTKPLPVVMYEEVGYTLSVTAGDMTLAADSTYTASITVLETVDGNKSTYVDREAGAWTQGEGGAITLKPATTAPYTAVWSGTTLTVTRDDFKFAYTMTGR